MPRLLDVSIALPDCASQRGFQIQAVSVQADFIRLAWYGVARGKLTKTSIPLYNHFYISLELPSIAQSATIPCSGRRSIYDHHVANVQRS